MPHHRCLTHRDFQPWRAARPADGHGFPPSESAQNLLLAPQPMLHKDCRPPLRSRSGRLTGNVVKVSREAGTGMAAGTRLAAEICGEPIPLKFRMASCELFVWWTW
jgi:hypothetical protein